MNNNKIWRNVTTQNVHQLLRIQILVPLVVLQFPSTRMTIANGGLERKSLLGTVDPKYITLKSKDI